MRAEQKDSLLVLFWNVENFFDWTDHGTGKADKEFSSYGDRHWTKDRFYAKCDAIAKSLMWIADRYGQMPDFIGLAEVENRGVLTKLLSSTLLRKSDYAIIHHDSGDSRGIDVAILYRKSSMFPLSITVKSTEGLDTRDILHARMQISDCDTVDFIVNHHPSKYGGEQESMPKRMKVMNSLKELIDSLSSDSLGKGIIAMGDFNDTPDASQFEIIGEDMKNLGSALSQEGEGSIRYKGKWELIDFFLASQTLSVSEMQVVKIPFLMTYEKKYPGEKPLRTYSGPRYNGGISDHCPVIIKFKP